MLPLVTLAMFAFSLVFAPVAQALILQPLDIDQNFQTIGTMTAVMAESGSRLDLEEVREAFEMGRFAPAGHAVLSFGIGVAPVWVTFLVHNAHPKSVFRRLVIRNSWLDEVDIYFIHSGSVVEAEHLGDLQPFSRRPIKHRFLVLEPAFHPGLTQVFIRTSTPDPLILPISLKSQEQAYNQDVFDGYSYGMLYGLLAGLMLYNLILFFQLRHYRYLFYVIYLASFIAMNLSYTGHSFAWLWPRHIHWQQWACPLLILLYATTGMFFAFSFLHAEAFFPKSYRYGIGVILAIWAIQGIMFFSGNQAKAVMIAIAGVIFFTCFVLFLASMSLRIRHREAIYFIIATVSSLIGSSITALTAWGMIPYHELGFRATEMGVSIDAILLSIALGYQFRVVQKEKLTAIRVARLDPLTGLFNRRAFPEVTEMIVSKTRSQQIPVAVIVLDIDRFKVINDTYGHGVGDKVIVSIAEALKDMLRENDIPFRWGGEEFILLLPATHLRQAVQLAERLRRRILELQITAEKSSVELSFTVSMGVAANDGSNGFRPLEHLIEVADVKLYQAKGEGRNRVCY